MKNLMALLFAVVFTTSGFAQKQDFTKSGDSDPENTKLINLSKLLFQLKWKFLRKKLKSKKVV